MTAGFSRRRPIPDGGSATPANRSVGFPGVVTLLGADGAGDDVWLHLPGPHKVRRVPASNEKDSSVSTDFPSGEIMGYKVERDGKAQKWQVFDIEARNQQTGHAIHLIVTKLETGVGDDVFTTRVLEPEK